MSNTSHENDQYDKPIGPESMDAKRGVARRHHGGWVGAVAHTRAAVIAMRVMVAGGVAAAIAVGVVGVTFDSAPSAPPAAAARTIRSAIEAGSSGATSKQQLLQTVGILRMSPTAADRALIACIKRTANRFGAFKCLGDVPEVIQIIEHPAPVARGFLASLRHPKLDLTLIRTITLRRSGGSVMFFPVSWQSSPSSASRTWGIVAGSVDHEETEALPTSVRTLRAHGIPLFPESLYVGRPKNLRVHEGTIIVPDGVAKITVGIVSMGGGASVRENATAAVHDNVAAVLLRMPTFTTGFGFGPGSALRMTWFDAHGKVIRHTTDALGSFGQVSPR